MRFILKFRTCPIRWATYGTPINNFSFFGERPLPVLPIFSQNGQLVLGTRYGAEIMIILKLGTCIFKCATDGTSIHNFTISVKDPLPDLPNILLKSITNSMNALRRREQVHIDKTQSRNTVRGRDEDHIVA